MRYRVEYLRETTEEHSVCHCTVHSGNLDAVEATARIRGASLMLRFGADGFQIRDLGDNDRIVVLESFANPLWRFWPNPGDKVVH